MQADAHAAPEEVVKQILNNHNECDYKGTFDKNIHTCIPDFYVDKIRKQVLKDAVVTGKKEVVEKAKKKLDCDSESCVIVKAADKIGIGDITAFLQKYFKPHGPHNTFGLLSNVNIDEMLNKLSEQFPARKFLHIPYQMRDFDKVKSELSRINIAHEFANNHKTFGVVLNTDVSSGGGIHWFCLFGEKRSDRVQLEYFNSSGRAPLEEVQIVLNRMKASIEQKWDTRIHYSTGINFQQDNHSCGVYCVAYIWFRLLGIPAQWFRAENFNDGLMHAMRKYVFRWSK